ncbi:hypothetical protein [Vibrio tritonius]|uniref:hypothetical protein n=1 Tax=Vibrio tritonius TaxID=1435069 RepID=UPI00083982C6|nr:hypothetical protein [Vibrio tritonius]
MRFKLSVILLSAVLTSCASNDHLVFFTNTTIGLEVGSEPSSGNPAKFVLGYKRQEGVIDPLIPDYEFHSYNGSETIAEPRNGNTNVILTPAGVASPKGSITNAHSVLAKMNFGATGGGTGASAAQWFATGRAAELIAQSSGVSGALSGDPENNISPSIAIDKSTGNLSTYAYLGDVYNILKKAAEEGNVVAVELKSKVDLIDNGKFKYSFDFYSWDDEEETKLVISAYDTKNNEHYFPNVIQYLTTLNLSTVVSETALTKSSITVSGLAISEEQRNNLLDVVKNYPQRYKEGVDELSDNETIIEMINYVHKSILFNDTLKSNEDS